MTKTEDVSIRNRYYFEEKEELKQLLINKEKHTMKSLTRQFPFISKKEIKIFVKKYYPQCINE